MFNTITHGILEQAGTSSPGIPSGIFAFWQFEDNLNNSIDGSNNLVDLLGIAYADGKIGRCLVVNGLTNSVASSNTYPATDLLENTNSWGFNFWFKLDDGVFPPSTNPYNIIPIVLGDEWLKYDCDENDIVSGGLGGVYCMWLKYKFNPTDVSSYTSLSLCYYSAGSLSEATFSIDASSGWHMISIDKGYNVWVDASLKYSGELGADLILNQINIGTTPSENKYLSGNHLYDNATLLNRAFTQSDIDYLWNSGNGR